MVRTITHNAVWIDRLPAVEAREAVLTAIVEAVAESRTTHNETIAKFALQELAAQLDDRGNAPVTVKAARGKSKV